MNVQTVLSPARRLFLTVSTTLQSFQPERFEVSIPEQDGSERETFKARLLYISKPQIRNRRGNMQTVRVLTLSRSNFENPIRALLVIERVVTKDGKTRVIPCSDIHDEKEREFPVLLYQPGTGEIVYAMLKKN